MVLAFVRSLFKWYFSCWLENIERIQALRWLFTFYIEFFSVWMSQRHIQNLKRWKHENRTGRLSLEILKQNLPAYNVALINNCHLNFCKRDHVIFKDSWSDQFWKWTIKLKWQVLCKKTLFYLYANLVYLFVAKLQMQVTIC